MLADSSRIICLLMALLFAASLFLFTGGIQAYDQYSVNKDATNCRACHGDFRATPYTEMAPGGVAWPSSAMDTHVDLMVDGVCLACHTSGPRFPVLTNSSTGDTGVLTFSCAGCHGRTGDGSDPNSTVGWGAGLRQRHWRADGDHPGMNLKICADCHTDADPNSVTPVGEDVKPFNYANPGSHTTIPSDPCNLSPAFDEDRAGTAVGLDNDGDGIYDGLDPDCSGVAATPGETAGPALAPLEVISHDEPGGVLSLTYGNACSVTDNTIVYGPLDQASISTYSYSGETCNIGNTGSYDWSYPPTPDSLFFLIVGNDGVVEGSYGKNNAGVERPDFSTDVTCPLPQSLAQRCD